MKNLISKKYIFLLPAAAVFLLICSCGGTKEVIREVPVEVPVYHNTATHDTIREYHNSITTMKGDTVYSFEQHYFHHIHHDTVHDSTAFPVYLHDTIDSTDYAAMEKEKAMRKDAQAREIFAWIAVVVLGLVLIFLTRRK